MPGRIRAQRVVIPFVPPAPATATRTATKQRTSCITSAHSQQSLTALPTSNPATLHNQSASAGRIPDLSNGADG